MLKEDIAEPLQAIISSMYNLSNTQITLEEQNRGISVTINLKNYAYMNFIYTQHKEKDKGSILIRTDGDFPIYAYHNSISRLSPIYDQLLFLGKHPKYANSDLMMSFSSIISNVSLMLGEETLIKTENNITDKLPPEYRQKTIIFCGPVGDYFVFTIHFVEAKGSLSSVSMSALNQNANNSLPMENNANSNTGNSQFSAMPNSYSSPAASQTGNINNNSNNSSTPQNPSQIASANSDNSSTQNETISTNPSSSANINLSSTSSSALNSSTVNFASQQRIPVSRSNGNLVGSSSINSPLLETASISPSSLNYESPAFWKPFTKGTIFPHLGREYVVVDSVMLRTKFKIQSTVLSQLKSLHMLLSSISINLSVEEEDIEEEEIESDDDDD